MEKSENDTLPQGWSASSIQDCAQLNPKIDKKEISDDKQVHFVPMPAVSAKTNHIDVSQTRQFSEVKKGYTPFLPQDVLFAKITPCMENGKMCIVPELEHDLALGSTEFHVLRPTEAIAPEWLYYYVSSDFFRHEAEHNMTGAVGQKRVPIKFIADHDIPLPPLNEQKRIVTKIEELFSELDAGEESFKQARKQLGIYRQSLLKQAFEGKLTEQWRADNPDKLEDPKQLLARIQQERETRHQQQLTDCQQATQQWEQNGKKNKKPTKPTKLAALELFDRDELPDSAGVPEGWLLFPYGLLCSIVRNGISQKPQGTSGYKISRISAVRPRFFDYEDYRYISCDEDTASNFSLTKGDLIFTRYNGARRYVGVCAQFTGKEPRLYPDKLIRTRPDLPTIDSSFLEYALNSGPSRAWLETKIRTTAGQSGVSGGDIKAMPAPLCSLPEQQEIVRLLEEQFTVIEQNEREIDAALERSAALRQSILKRAFTGQLVPQDPTDEPASVLLERIQAERKAQSELGRAKKTAKKKTARKLARKSVTREKPE